MNKIKSIIVDDELHGRENLRKIIEIYCPEVEIIGVAESVIKARELVAIHKPDLVFLDIYMPVLDGFDFLSGYDERNFMVVFVSAYEKYGIKAVKAGAVDYLLKPIDIKELTQTIKKLMLRIRKNPSSELPFVQEKIVLPESHGFNVVQTSSIIRLEANGCYTKVIINEGKNKIVSKSLKEFEDSLPRDTFFRVHKSHLINLTYLKEYSNICGNLIMMTDGSQIELSRRKAPDFIKRIKTSLKKV
ncbi:MAG: LytTR family DNA-binding domain-containing protein [Melioribacteraceae bacterium]